MGVDRDGYPSPGLVAGFPCGDHMVKGLNLIRMTMRKVSSSPTSAFDVTEVVRGAAGRLNRVTTAAHPSTSASRRATSYTRTLRRRRTCRVRAPSGRSTEPCARSRASRFRWITSGSEGGSRGSGPSRAGGAQQRSCGRTRCRSCARPPPPRGRAASRRIRSPVSADPLGERSDTEARCFARARGGVGTPPGGDPQRRSRRRWLAPAHGPRQESGGRSRSRT
jgi:hypothetical protein